jgi:hypothetical protein
MPSDTDIDPPACLVFALLPAQAVPPMARPRVTSSRTICRSHYAQDLLPSYELLHPQPPFSIGSYDGDKDVQEGKAHPLSINKNRLRQAFNVGGGLVTAVYPFVSQTQCNPQLWLLM